MFRKDIQRGIIVQCRYDSQRLPGKILMKIRGKEVLNYIYERLRCAHSVNGIVIATSNQPDDDPIVEFCIANHIPYFRGSKEDVAQRLLECAKVFGFDYFVRLCGDNVFTDYQVVDQLVCCALEGDYDFVSNVKERTFPSGISVEVIKTRFFENMISRFDQARYHEHATLYFYEHEKEVPQHFYFYNSICPQAKSIKLSLDDENDLEFVRKIIERMNKDHTEYLFKDIHQLSQEITELRKSNGSKGSDGRDISITFA